MGNRTPGASGRFGDDAGTRGPIGVNADNDVADAGTRGPIGVNADADVAEARAMDATMRKNEKQPKSDQITQVLIGEDIKLIAASPPGQTKEGLEIVALLRQLNHNHDIVYDDTGDARGDWDGHTIRINQNYTNKIYPTAIELVHEATHALWRRKHQGEKKGTPANERSRSIDDEFHAQQNQLEMYRHFHDTGRFDSWEMNLRLDRLDKGTLRAGIEQGFVEH